MNPKNKKTIYLDYAATAPIDPLVLKTMMPYFAEKFGNPNSPHLIGQEALIGVDNARTQVAKLLNCSTREVLFTSGATESNNLAIRGVIKKYRGFIKSPEIITTKIEHPSVLNTCADLEKQGIRVKYLDVNNDGIVNPADLYNLISDSTVLVSVMFANNEIGTVQPVREIGKIIEKINKDRKFPIVFHTDAVQAISTLNCDVLHSHVDLLSFSGHKIYGPKGVGVLYVKKGTPIAEIQTGGDQEYSLRAGTLPVALIVGLGKAAQLSSIRRDRDNLRMTSLRDWVMAQIKKTLPDTEISGAMGELRLANNLHLRTHGIDGNDIMFLMDLRYQIAVSTGSACTIGAAEPSKVLMAIGLSEAKSREGIRVSMGRTINKSDLVKFVGAYTKIVAELEKKTTGTD